MRFPTGDLAILEDERGTKLYSSEQFTTRAPEIDFVAFRLSKNSNQE